jgi:hypothetical protein
LWSKYKQKRRNLSKIVQGWVEERHLFHGTVHADDIMENGFNIKYANENSMFGKGRLRFP